MKTNFFISAFALILYAQSAPAAISGPVDCINCTLYDGSTCIMYAATCCDPCKQEPIDPPVENCLDCGTKGCKTYSNTGKDCCKQCNTGSVTPLTNCSSGEYYNGSSCTSCPNGGTSDCETGRFPCQPAITDCYLPSGTGFSDNTGSGEYSGNCYYSD